MLDWNKVKKDKALLEKVEELVNDVAHTYHDFPDDIRDELNRLTGNDWSGDNYIEYCGGYEESFWSLEATVYALFHDGEYPDLVENEMNFIRPLDKSVLPTLDILNKLCNAKPDDSFRAQFEPLPISEIEKWFTKRFARWEKEIETEEDDDDDGKYSYGETDIYFDYTGKIEYGYEKNITLSLSNDRSGYINAEGLTPEEWNDILNYFKNAGGYTLMEM